MYFKWYQIFWNILCVLSIIYYFIIIVVEGFILYVNVFLEKVFYIMKFVCRIDEYFDRVVQDLEVFVYYVGRKIIDERDVELFFKRYSVFVFIFLIFILFLMYE